MKRRDATARGTSAASADQRTPAAGTPRALGEEQAAQAAGGGLGNGPVIVLAYAHSEAGKIQDALAADTGLACTSGTGILPMCASAAETWRRVEARNGHGMSRLAAVTIRNLVTAQVTTILAGAGKARWCELSTAAPSTAEPFLRLFPSARFLCVHRSCLEVVRAGLRASPWGLQGQGFVPYLLSYPGNNVAALAAYWVSSTEQLLAFEESNSELACRVRYEDVIADPNGTLTAVKATLRLETLPQDDVFAGQPGEDEPESTPVGAQTQVPAEMIPEPLRERIARLHARLGYPPPEK